MEYVYIYMIKECLVCFNQETFQHFYNHMSSSNEYVSDFLLSFFKLASACFLLPDNGCWKELFFDAKFIRIDTSLMALYQWTEITRNKERKKVINNFLGLATRRFPTIARLFVSADGLVYLLSCSKMTGKAFYLSP